MEKHSEVFVGLDVAKAKNAVAIAEGGRNGEVRYLGEIENTPETTRRLIAKLSKTYRKMTFCYEAGPTGYGLFRWICDLGHECIVVAPSLIPMKAGDRVKTNRRDAENLAKLLRAGELTAVWGYPSGNDGCGAPAQSYRDDRSAGFVLRHVEQVGQDIRHSDRGAKALPVIRRGERQGHASACDCDGQPGSCRHQPGGRGSL